MPFKLTTGDCGTLARFVCAAIIVVCATAVSLAQEPSQSGSYTATMDRKVDTVAPLHGACFMVLLPQTKTALMQRPEFILPELWNCRAKLPRVPHPLHD